MSLSVDTPPVVRFGRFELDLPGHRLLEDGRPVALGARAFDLLVVLVERAGQLVTKNDLLARVWPGLVVEENNLQVQVSTLRKLLGPSALATVPGRGYRFELPVANQAESWPRPDPDAAPPAAPAPTRPRTATNLPPRLSSLYGRADDVAAVKALLTRHAVVTIAGAGGIGKTRLAEAVAAEVAVEGAADHPAGVWWIELAPLADGAYVPSAVARVLGVQLPADRPPVDTLSAVLASQRLLLVLDNCEHLTDDVASFVESIGAAAAGVRVLVTSQESLKVADEHVYRLGALAIPSENADRSGSHGGAVELFVARAQGVNPRFELTASNEPAIVEICRRLDGIPLAIELAAARLPLLGVEGLRTRLGERFSVLTAGARVRLRRHQTLRATLEWSHSLLAPDEQTVFRRLGVFAGSFTLEAAQHVVHDERIDPWAALDILGTLVDKSLVLAEGDSVPRYRLLETTRAYAVERLGEAGETEAMLRRHAEALLQLLTGFEHDDQHEPRITAASLSAAGAELDNLRAALAWATSAGNGDELALALIGKSLRVWSTTHQLAEGMARCLALRDRIRDEMPPATIARFWLTLSRLGLYSMRKESHLAATRAADIYRQLGDAIRLFDALVSDVVQGVRFGTVEHMAEALDEAESLVQPDWPLRKRVQLEFARCRWHVRQGRMEDALAAAQRQVAYSAEVGHEIGMHYGMSNVVSAEIQLGRTELALEHARSSIARLDIIGGSAGAGHLWLAVLNAEALLGRVDAAIAAGRTAYALLLREGDELRVFPGLALCAALQAREADAARILGYHAAVHARAGTVAEYWTRIPDRLEPLLRAAISPEAIELHKAEGAAMSEAQAARLALGTPG
ncbi:MAG: winged helix-turn-helix domain-containing protein [Burkholderiales bacterium]